MKIKYLKNAPLGQIGDISDVEDSQAGVLITLGFAEAVVDKPKRQKSKSEKVDNNTTLELS